MTGTLLTIGIVFAILIVMTRSIGYYRGNFSVVGAEREGTAGAGRSAAVGAGAGLVVLVLLLLLYFGVTRWDWFGHQAPRSPVVAVPRAQPSPALGAVGASPAPGAGGASPSPSASASPHP